MTPLPLTQPTFLPHFEQHHTYLYKLALRTVRDPDDAADVLQETLVRAWKRFPDDAENPRAWLSRVTFHAAISYIRTQRARGGKDIPLSAFAGDDVLLPAALLAPEVDPDAMDEVRATLCAMTTLRPSYQRALRCAASGLTADESMAATGLSRRRFTETLCRARAALRSALGIARVAKKPYYPRTVATGQRTAVRNRASDRAYRERNRERLREQQKIWSRRWREKDPERVRAIDRANYHRRRQRLLASTAVPPKETTHGSQ